MAYAKQTWANNDPTTPLSDERLNHMEDGIAAASTQTLPALSQAVAETGTATTASSVTAAVLKAAVVKHAPVPLALGTTAGTALAGNTTIPAAAAAGTAAQLTTGTDTVQRTWSAKMIADYVAAQIAAIPPA